MDLNTRIYTLRPLDSRVHPSPSLHIDSKALRYPLSLRSSLDNAVACLAVQSFPIAVYSTLSLTI